MNRLSQPAVRISILCGESAEPENNYARTRRGLQPGLHHPHMTFDRNAMFNGIHILANAVLKTFQKAESPRR